MESLDLSKVPLQICIKLLILLKSMMIAAKLDLCLMFSNRRSTAKFSDLACKSVFNINIYAERGSVVN